MQGTRHRQGRFQAPAGIAFAAVARYCAGMLRPVLLVLVAVLASPATQVPGGVAAQQYDYDVVVYGATAGGTIAAIAAAKEGRSVALLEPRRHVGGMITGGLGRTDMDRQQHVIGGMSREFFERVGAHYGEQVSWLFEPKVAQQVLLGWLKEANVPVFYEQRLRGVRKKGATIVSLDTEGGRSYAARVFIDATYEGDLFTAAGVSYAIGREDRSKYGESLAGRQDILPGGHQLRVATSPYGPDGTLLPYLVRQDDVAQIGEGDGRIQSYCFRLCVTKNPANRLPIPRPDNYEKAPLGLVRNYVKSLGANARLGDFLGISELPNQKTDINASVVSTNLVGASWDYPEASHERRQEIWDEHLLYAQSLLYFLGHDPSVPAHVREEMQQWGLAKDEFVDTGHWPHQMYVREARRMVGEHVLTQHDLQTNRRKYDSIGMGGYNIDIREVQWIARQVYRFPNVSDEVLMEGYVSVPVEAYDIPYRSLLPRQGEADNLLVPTCISSSHVAYASFRMEPQYMIAGQAAGVAAAMAVAAGVPVHHVNIPALQQRLKEQQQILPLEAQ
jgi:hypothetical protein